MQRSSTLLEIKTFAVSKKSIYSFRTLPEANVVIDEIQKLPEI
jgi:hypothetical protein